MIPWLALLVTATPELTFDAALAQADAQPALEAARVALARRRALANDVPWLTANPAIMVQPGARAFASGSARPELYVQVTQDVSLSGAGTTRRAAAQAEVKLDAVDLTQLRRTARVSVAHAWLTLWAAQDALAAANHELELTTDWQRTLERGAAAGGFTRVDLAVASAYHAEAHLTALSLEGEVFERGVALNRALGVDAPNAATVSSTLPTLELPVHDDAAVVSAADRAPLVEVARATVVAERARGSELVAARGASLQVGALGWVEGTGDVAAVGILQLTLPVFEHAQRERSVSAAALARAEGRVHTAVAEARAERLELLHEVSHTAEVLKVTERELMPSAVDAVEGQQRRFDAGEATAQELVVTRRALVAAQARLSRARADVTWARFRLATSLEGEP